MKYCIHISTISSKLVKYCRYINKIVEDTDIARVFCYIEDSLTTVEDAKAQFTTLSPSLVEFIHAPKSSDFKNFTQTLAAYPATDDIWIISLNDSIVYPDSLIETYTAIIDDASIKYAYGFFGYVLDGHALGDVKGLVHVIDQTLSTCYHRTFFHKKWENYIAPLFPLLDVSKHSHIIFSNWFAVNGIDRLTIDVPWCNIDLLKTLNSDYTHYSDEELFKAVFILQQHNLYFLKVNKHFILYSTGI